MKYYDRRIQTNTASIIIIIIIIHIKRDSDCNGNEKALAKNLSRPALQVNQTVMDS